MARGRTVVRGAERAARQGVRTGSRPWPSCCARSAAHVAGDRRRLGDPRRAGAPARRRVDAARRPPHRDARRDRRPRLAQRRARRRRLGASASRIPASAARGSSGLAVRAVVVAIDGPAGAGKSTVARAVAGGSATATSTPARCTAPSRWRPARRRRQRRRRGPAALGGPRRDADEATRGCGRPRSSGASPRVARQPSVREALQRRAARLPRRGRRGRRGPRHRRRRVARGRAEDLARRRSRGARAPPRAGAGRAAAAAALAERDRRDARRPCARPMPSSIDSTDLASAEVVARIVGAGAGARGVSDVPGDDYRIIPPERIWGFCAPAARGAFARIIRLRVYGAEHVPAQRPGRDRVEPHRRGSTRRARHASPRSIRYMAKLELFTYNRARHVISATRARSPCAAARPTSRRCGSRARRAARRQSARHLRRGHAPAQRGDRRACSRRGDDRAVARAPRSCRP